MLMTRDHEQSSLSSDSPMTDKRKNTISPHHHQFLSSGSNNNGEERLSGTISSSASKLPSVIQFLGDACGATASSIHSSSSIKTTSCSPLLKKKISSAAEQDKVQTPRPADVLLGRGKPFQNHPGNQRMLHLVDEYRALYLQSERQEKHAIIEGVMKSIKNSGGRFLIRVDYENYWVEVNHSIAYRKVGHAFRSKVRRTDTNNTPSVYSIVSSQQKQGETMASTGTSGGKSSVFDTNNNIALLNNANLAATRSMSDSLRFLPALSNNISAGELAQQQAAAGARTTLPPLTTNTAVGHSTGHLLGGAAGAIQTSGDINNIKIPYMLSPSSCLTDLQLPSLRLAAAERSSLLRGGAGWGVFPSWNSSIMSSGPSNNLMGSTNCAAAGSSAFGGLNQTATFLMLRQRQQQQQELALRRNQQLLSAATTNHNNNNNGVLGGGAVGNFMNQLQQQQGGRQTPPGLLLEQHSDLSRRAQLLHSLQQRHNMIQ